MADEKEFQEKMRRLGALVGDLDQAPGAGSKVAARELVQLLMEVHRSGLERIMELVFESGREPGAPGAAIIDRLGQDPIVRNLLLLYSLHPDDLETRVSRALDVVRARLRKFDGRVELISLQDEPFNCGFTLPVMHAVPPSRICAPLWKAASMIWRRI